MTKPSDRATPSRPSRPSSWLRIAVPCLLVSGLLFAATLVPNEVQQPGTQPGQVTGLESPDKCDNCHGGYDQAVEPAHNWRGSMMANAGRDPIFWATVAVAEQDFDGAGDLCIRCHSTQGWYAGRSTPTDGSGLSPTTDADGVDCDTCHKMTNPDNSEHLGTMTAPFLANDENTPPSAYYGSGMLSLYGGAEKLGPYSDPAARHQFLQSKFHRSTDFCGSCHDVSNPAVGDLAHNNGAQVPLAAGTFSGVPGAPVDQKAAFNNFPYQYGVVERTQSEYKSGLLSQTLVSSYASLPADLQAGSIKAAYDSAKGNYSDGTPRYFSCQTCHMRAITGVGCNKTGAPVRTDLPLHDMTGGNYWAPDAILYQNTQGTLRLGGGLTAIQIAAIQAGKLRAQQNLLAAASLSVSGNTLKVTNLTGHKLISGYPEGRRMWLNIKWYDENGTLLREDGRYGPLTVSIDGAPATVNTILDLEDPNTKIYEAHYAMTQEWAGQLIALGKPAVLPLAFDRTTGAVQYTLGDLAAQAPGTHYETFHFVLNNTVVKDNRIPPYGMSYDEARKRNALPVPADQYGAPGPGGAYRYWDALALNPPAGATYGNIRLLYQPTSWEYVQFLYLANARQNAFLGQEGVNLLQAWRNTSMAEPFLMASATWGAAPGTKAITVLSPNGAEAWELGTTHTIQWTYSGAVGSTVKVQLYKNGVLWSNLSTAAPVGSGGDGSFTWTISKLLASGADYRVRVTSAADPAVFDWTNANFSLTAPASGITVSSPNGGESWALGSTHTVQWTYYGTVGPTVKVQLYKGFTLWSNLNTSAAAGSGGAGSWSWTVSNQLALGSDYRIRVTSASDPGILDSSDAPLSLVAPANSLTVVAPNGAETWQRGTVQTIRWTYTGNVGTSVRIELLKSGVLWSTISTNAPVGAAGSGSFSWTIPAVLAAASDYKVRITSVSDPTVADYSNAAFALQ